MRNKTLEYLFELGTMSRLLLVEDDQETVEEITEYFRIRDYHVDHCPTGPDGLVNATEAEPDVIVVDRLPPARRH